MGHCGGWAARGMFLSAIRGAQGSVIDVDVRSYDNLPNGNNNDDRIDRDPAIYPDSCCRRHGDGRSSADGDCRPYCTG